MKYLVLSIILLAISPLILSAQNSLNRAISVNIQQQRLEDALFIVADAGGFNISYNSDDLEIEKEVSLNVENLSVREILFSLIGHKMDYKVRGSYVIILPEKKASDEKKTFQLTGEIADANTGQKISEVTIYEVSKLNSTLTDSSGNYDFVVSDNRDYIFIAISKENYRDTVIQISSIDRIPLDIKLEPIPTPLHRDADVESYYENYEAKGIVKLFVNAKSFFNARNVTMVEHRKFQFSILPMIGTNKQMSGRVSNTISLNLIAGYSKGVTAFEFGTVANIIREDLSGVQIAGLGNYVGGQTDAVQIAGGFNINKGKVRGMQISAGANVVADSMSGVQLTGGANFVAKEMKGFQMSPVNYSGELKGLQIGVVNVNKNFKSGFSFGIVNVHDTVEKGVSLALLSFVRKGMHVVDFSSNEALHFNVSFKTGTHHLYNILTAGIHQSTAEQLWSYGYGLGTQINMGKHFFTNLELTAHAIHPFDKWISELNLLNRFSVNLGVKLGDVAILYGGPALSVYVSQVKDPDTQVLGNEIGPKPIYENDSQSTLVKMWIGYQAGLSF